MTSAVRTLLKKELLDALRDRRAVVMMLVLPLLLYPAVLTLIGVVVAAGQKKLAREELTVAVTSPDAEALLGAPPEHTHWTHLDRREAEAALKDKKVWAIVDLPAGAQAALAAGRQVQLVLVYTKRHDRSVEAFGRLRKVTRALSVRSLETRLLGAGLPADFAEPLKVEELDADFQKDLGPLIASHMLPIILIVMLFAGAIYPAIDVIAGEKERGTLETLLVAPVRPLEVMFAKFMVVAAMAAVATLVNLAAMSLTFGLGPAIAPGLSTSVVFRPAQLAVLVACLLPTALMVSGVALAVASLARTFKEGQSLMAPVSLVGMVPGLLAQMPGMELGPWTAWIPLLNVALLIKAVVLGSAQLPHVLIVLVTVVACAMAALWVAANAFQSEALRFGGLESWRELFRRRP